MTELVFCDDCGAGMFFCASCDCYHHFDSIPSECQVEKEKKLCLEAKCSFSPCAKPLEMECLCWGRYYPEKGEI